MDFYGASWNKKVQLEDEFLRGPRKSKARFHDSSILNLDRVCWVFAPQQQSFRGGVVVAMVAPGSTQKSEEWWTVISRAVSDSMCILVSSASVIYSKIGFHLVARVGVHLVAGDGDGLPTMENM